MPRRLSITVAGAVSLGSFEAGVLYELLYAIGQHNVNPQTAPEDRVFIDVMTGASAGGLAVSLSAQKLLYEGNSLSNPYDNPLFGAWVVDTDLQQMLSMQPDEPSDHSVLSSDYIYQLACKYLTTRYKTPPASPVRHPAVNPETNRISLGLALSNLNGIDYSLKTMTGDPFTYTKFEDQFCQILGSDTDEISIWTTICAAAVSCGAFPFAFRTRDLSRAKACFPDPTFDGSAWPSDPHTFTYTDGGLFQNQPLGMAKNFVDDIDNHLDTDTRAYFFCAPDAKRSVANTDFSSKNANFWVLAQRLLGAIVGQSEYQDWIQAQEVNHQIQLFNKRSEALKDMLVDGKIDGASLANIAEPIVQQFFSSAAGQNTALANAREQLRKQFGAEYNEITANKGQQIADAWIDAILAFELSADLHEKDEMFIYQVTASPKELAGGGLMAFLGFLDEKYRRHDYNVGRSKAQAQIQKFGQSGPLPKLNYRPQPVETIDPNLGGIGADAASVEERKRLRDQLEIRANLLLKEANLPLILREPLELFFVNRKLSQFLGL